MSNSEKFFCWFCGCEVEHCRIDIVKKKSIYKCTGEEKHCFDVEIKGIGLAKKIISIQPRG